MRCADKIFAMSAAILLIALSAGCEAGENGTRLRNNSGLTLPQLGALLEEVKHADAAGNSRSCRPTGEAAPSSQTSRLLAGSSIDKVTRAIKAPPYALDPRDFELTIDVGRSDTWLIVTVRVERGRCVGYSLSTMQI
jgi:hypothetical protein